MVELRSRKGGGDGSAGRARRLLDEERVADRLVGQVAQPDADIRCQTPVIEVARRFEQCREALRAGPSGLLFDPALAGEQRSARADLHCRLRGSRPDEERRDRHREHVARGVALRRRARGHPGVLRCRGARSARGAHWERHYEDRGIASVELNCRSRARWRLRYSTRRALPAVPLAARPRRRGALRRDPLPRLPGPWLLHGRRLGLAFADSMIVIGAHSPTAWVHEANGWPIGYPSMLVDDFLERRSVELADVLVSPSAYMLGWMQGARMVCRSAASSSRTCCSSIRRSRGGNALAEVDGTLVDLGATTPSTAWHARRYRAWGAWARPTRGRPPTRMRNKTSNESRTELVFFGRLEPRKGLDRVLRRPRHPRHRRNRRRRADLFPGQGARDWRCAVARLPAVPRWRWPWLVRTRPASTSTKRLLTYGDRSAAIVASTMSPPNRPGGSVTDTADRERGAGRVSPAPGGRRRGQRRPYARWSGACCPKDTGSFRPSVQARWARGGDPEAARAGWRPAPPVRHQSGGECDSAPRVA